MIKPPYIPPNFQQTHKKAILPGNLGYVWNILWEWVDGKRLRPVWEIQQQGILIRGSAALMQEDILNTWNLVDTCLCWNYFIVLKLALVPYKTLTVDRSCLSHKNVCRLSWDNNTYFQMLIHVSNSSNLGSLSVSSSAAVPFKIVKLGRK